MRFAIFMVLMILSIVAPILLGNALAASYESRLWNQKSEDLVEQCSLVASRIATAGFRFSDMNGALGTEIQQYATLIEGRIMVIDQSYRIVKDTFGIETNRYLLTEDVLRTMAGESPITKKLDRQFLEVTYPVKSVTDDHTAGVVCAIASTQSVSDTISYMNEKKNN